MKHPALTVCLLLAVAALAAGVETSIEPVSKEPLHFRLEVGARPGHVVTGWIDESKGTGEGYDLAVLDLDGDGVFETKQVFGTQKNYTTQKQVPKPVIAIEREGARWALDVYSLGMRRPAIKDGSLVTYVRWSVTKGDFYAWFINGRVTLYTDAAKAKAAPTIRLGPPFTFDTGSATRGADALVRIGLKDGLGCTMRLARIGREQRRIEVALRAGEKEMLSTHAQYG